MALICSIVMLNELTDMKMLSNRVESLDNKVSELDNKVSHVIQMNSELMIQTGENYRNLRNTLEDQKEELKTVFKKLRAQTSTKCQWWFLLVVLVGWTVLMMWILFSKTTP